MQLDANCYYNGFVCFIIKVCLESIEDIIFSLRQNSKQEKNIAERWNKNVWCDRQEIRKKNTGQHTPKCPIKNLRKKFISFSVAIYNSKRGNTILNEKRKLKYVAKKSQNKEKIFTEINRSNDGDDYKWRFT
jgi:hypothetical protein